MARAHAFGLVGSAAVALALGSLGCVDGNVPPRPEPTFGPPSQLVSAPGCGAMAIAVNGGTLFWTEEANHTVSSMPISGGPITVLASDQIMPGSIVANATSAFWIVDAKSIAKIARTGGPSEVLVESTHLEMVEGGENDINGLIVQGAWLYFGRHIRTYRVATTGGAPEMIGKSPGDDDGRPTGFAVDDTHIYQTEALHNAVSRVRLDGHQEGKLESGSKAMWAPDRIAVSQGSLLLQAIGLGADSVVWANSGTIYRKAVGQLEDKPFVQVTATLGAGDVTGFVVSGKAVYFGENNSDLLQRATLPSGAATVVATGQFAPRRFVADGDAIYWRTDDCTIMRLPIR
jgi:hypothetical protein